MAGNGTLYFASPEEVARVRAASFWRGVLTGLGTAMLAALLLRVTS
jgi:hypothetical protein